MQKNFIQNLYWINISYNKNKFSNQYFNYLYILPHIIEINILIC